MSGALASYLHSPAGPFTDAPDGDAHLAPGAFEGFPDLRREHSRFAAVLGRNKTPVFLADNRILAARYTALERALAAAWGPSAVAYSFKTNMPVAESGVLRLAGAHAEVVSGREFRIARRLGYPFEQIVFNGPWKPDNDLREALQGGALIHLDGWEELDRVVAMSAELSTPPRVGLRLRQANSRFGFSLDDDEAALAVERLAAAGLDLAGVHVHLKGDTDDPGLYRDAADRVAQFLMTEVPRSAETMRSIDMGGGFPAVGTRPRSRDRWDPRPIEEYVDAIVAGLAPAFPPAQRPALIVEPGRYLVADAIVLATRILRAHREGDRQVLTADATITMLGQRHYRPQVARVHKHDLRPADGVLLPTTVFGSSCREDDVLYEGPLAAAGPGNRLVFYATGAYCSSFAPSFIFDPPPVAFVE